MFIPALFTAHPKLETTQMDIKREWIYKFCYIKTMEYYFTIKRNEITDMYNNKY